MIYLDNSATTRPFAEVVQAMQYALEEGYYNPSSLYAQAMRGEEMLSGMRSAVRTALHLPTDGWEVTLTSGGTESDNMAIIGTALALRGRKGHFITDEGEHPAVLEAMRAVKGMGHSLTVLPLDVHGYVRPETLEEALTDDTALVSIMHVGNETGVMQPIGELARLTKARCPRALFHCDGVQGFLRVTPDFTHVDMYSLSAHKVHGPKGTGALVRKKGVVLLPLLHGGGQEGGLRSGTENTAGALGLTTAIETFQDLKDPSGHMRELKMRLFNGILNAVPDACVNGPEPPQAAAHILNMSFTVPGEVLLHALEGKGILVSTRSACSSRKKEKGGPLRAMGLSESRVSGAIRFSLSPLTTLSEIDRTIEAVGTCVTELMRYRRK